MKFKRVNPNYGTAYACIGEKVIKIEGREVYETEDEKEIQFLSQDPELVETDKPVIKDAEIVEDEAPRIPIKAKK